MAKFEDAVAAKERDAIIIGGGIIGCGAAHHLANLGMKVLLVEKHHVAGGQSGRNLGFVRAQGRDLRELPLMLESLRIWRGLDAELGAATGWHCGGNLAVARTAGNLARFEAWVAEARAFGLDSRIVTPSEAEALVPGYRAEGVGAMYTPGDGKAEPVRTTVALWRAAERLGAELILGSDVDEILTDGGRAAGVRIGQRRFRSRIVLCAAGAGTGRLLRKAGVQIAQETIRVTLARTFPTDVQIPPGIWGLDVGLRQSADGSINIADNAGDYDVHFGSLASIRYFRPLMAGEGPTVRINLLRTPPSAPPLNIPHGRGAPQPNVSRLPFLHQALGARFPALASLQFQTAWAGRIDATPDMLPVIGEADGVPGLLIGTGFSGHGFGIGPAAARALGALAAGAPPLADLNAFAPNRFMRGEWGAPANVV